MARICRIIKYYNRYGKRIILMGYLMHLLNLLLLPRKQRLLLRI
nr:MAG TPA: hypothetical protein [Caudoviricetes sp.]